jgi:hypothetical protein
MLRWGGSRCWRLGRGCHLRRGCRCGSSMSCCLLLWFGLRGEKEDENVILGGCDVKGEVGAYDSVYSGKRKIICETPICMIRC